MLLGRVMRCLTSIYGIFLLNLAYLLLGAWLFLAIEAPCEESIQNNLEEEREVLVESIIYFGKNLPDGYYGNASEKLAMYENTLANFYRKRATFKTATGNESLADMRLWTPFGAVIFCYSVITTIGWGNIVPTSLNGKLGTVIYGLNGMPLFFSLSNDVGTALNKLLFKNWNKLRRTILPFIRKPKVSKTSRAKNKSSSKPRRKKEQSKSGKENDASKNQSHNSRLRENKNQSQNWSPRIDNSSAGLNRLPAHQTPDSRQQFQGHSRYLSSLQSCVDFMLYAQSEVSEGRTPRHQPHFTITNSEDALLLWQVLARLPAPQARACMRYLGLDTQNSTTGASACSTTNTDLHVEDTCPTLQTYLPKFSGDTQEPKWWQSGQTGQPNQVQQCPTHPHDSSFEDSLQNNGIQKRKLGNVHKENSVMLKESRLSGTSWTSVELRMLHQRGTPRSKASYEPASVSSQVGIPASSGTEDIALLRADQRSRGQQWRLQPLWVPHIVALPSLPPHKYSCPYRDGPDKILQHRSDSKASLTGMTVRQQVAEACLELTSLSTRQEVVEPRLTSSLRMAGLRTTHVSSSPEPPAAPRGRQCVQMSDVGVTDRMDRPNPSEQRRDMMVSAIDGLLLNGSLNAVRSTSLSNNKTSLVAHKQINNIEPAGEINLGATRLIGNALEPSRHQTSSVAVPHVEQDFIQLPQNKVIKAARNPAAPSNIHLNKKFNHKFKKNSNKNFNKSSSDQEDTESELDDVSTIYSSGRLLSYDDDDEDEPEFISGVGMGFDPRKTAAVDRTPREDPFVGLFTEDQQTKAIQRLIEEEEAVPKEEEFLTDRMRMPMIVLYSIMLIYVFFGTLVINFWGNDKFKDFWDSLYFTYVLLSTTGFGDLLPTPDMYTFIVIYALVGMALYNVMINATLELFLEVIEYLGSIGNSPEDADIKESNYENEVDERQKPDDNKDINTK